MFYNNLTGTEMYIHLKYCLQRVENKQLFDTFQALFFRQLLRLLPGNGEVAMILMIQKKIATSGTLFSIGAVLSSRDDFMVLSSDRTHRVQDRIVHYTR